MVSSATIRCDNRTTAGNNAGLALRPLYTTVRTMFPVTRPRNDGLPLFWESDLPAVHGQILTANGQRHPISGTDAVGLGARDSAVGGRRSGLGTLHSAFGVGRSGVPAGLPSEALAEEGPSAE